MTVRFATRADAPLDGDVDLAAMLARTPASFTTKGMFFSRYVAALGAEWEGVVPELDAPARHGKYHAFEDYPLRDYFRLFHRVAAARFPGSTREAYRLLARGEVEVFADSTLGKVTFALLKDPGATLLRYPDVFKTIVKGPDMTAERRAPRSVIVVFPRIYGSVENGLGIVEGIVQSFDEEPNVTVSVDDAMHATYDVSW